MIARRHVCVSLNAVTNDSQTLTFQSLSQFDAPRIIYVDDRSSRSRAKAPIKQTLLGIPVIFHRLVIVEMVAREVGEDRNRILQRIAAMKVHRLRRGLHYCCPAT